MRVFCTGTGRIGSVSFREACRFAKNYETGHETKCGLLEYPDNFIEVSPQIRAFITHISAKYKDAKWVHLIREPESCIRSLSNLGHGSVMNAYSLLYPSLMPNYNKGDIAYRFYWAENDLIRAQLKACVPEENRIEMHLEAIKDEWRGFWDWAGIEGDFDASLASWDILRNTGKERGEA